MLEPFISLNSSAERIPARREKGPCSGQLTLLKDLGKTFTLVGTYVVQFNWGEVAIGLV